MAYAELENALESADPPGEPQPEGRGPSANDGELTFYGRRSRWELLDVAELWRYRELIWVLAARDLQVRYRQTVVGAAWAVIQPLAMMVVFTTLFKQLGRTPTTGDVAYPVALYTGLLPWQLFSSSVSSSSNSLVANVQLVTKVYFPRAVLTIAPLLVALVDFVIAFAVLIGLMVWYEAIPTLAVLTLPLLVLFTLVSALSISLWLSAVNAIYRDVQFVIPFLLQIGLFVSPVVYETRAIVPANWRMVYGLNPMVGVIDGFRWALLGHGGPPLETLLPSLLTVGLLGFGGLVYFRRVERTVADNI